MSDQPSGTLNVLAGGPCACGAGGPAAGCSAQPGGCSLTPVVLDPAIAQRSYLVAVTSRSGTFVDTHFGHAERFLVFRVGPEGAERLADRGCDKHCGGGEERDPCDPLGERAAMRVVVDCDAVVTMRIGRAAHQRLLDEGVVPVEWFDDIAGGLAKAREYLLELDAEVAAEQDAG